MASVSAGRAVLRQQSPPLIEPALQYRDRGRLIDHGALPAGAYPGLAQRTLGRHRGQPFVGEPDRHRGDPLGEAVGQFDGVLGR